MASKSRSRAPRTQRKPNQLAELGLFDIPDLETMDNDDDSEVDESTLESELEALLSGKAPSKPSRPKKAAAPVSPLDIERLAADCLKDDVEDDDDADPTMDEDLLKELHLLAVDENPSDEIPDISQENDRKAPSASDSSQNAQKSGIKVLEERLNLYNEALNAAKTLGDNSKVRRYGRAIKTLEGLLKAAKAGHSINEEEIPPIVSIPKKSSMPVPSTKQEPATNVPDTLKHENPPENICDDAQVPMEQTNSGLIKSGESSTAECLIMRRDQYKMAALTAKRAGDKVTALNYIKMSKTFDAVIEDVRNGQPIDLSTIPPPPPGYPEYAVQTGITSKQGRAHEEMQTSSAIEEAALSAANEPEDPEIFAAPPPPTSILEALQQRLDKYISTKQAAETEGNSGKVRRLQRIVKLYETAIKDYKAGKTVDFDALPTPPGFASIPLGNQPSAGSMPPNEAAALPKRQAPAVPGTKTAEKKAAEPGASKSAVPVKKPKIQRTNTSSVMEKQLEFLLERQKLFRQSALEAKRNGDMQAAKEYLRMSKGFDSMIEATKCGLPIDATTIPTPPQLEKDFVIVDKSECVISSEENQLELIETLEKDLTHQIEVCSRNKEHFLRLGDVSSASKFERLGLESRKDMSVIQNLKRKGSSPPKFHYETRLFSMVQCHPELSDNELEVTVERGINLPGKPDELDSFVKIEFPIPSEAPQRAKTPTVYDTNNPIFQEEFKFEINRKSRSQLRQFKRHALKLEVWSKGGFLRSNQLLGTVNIKLVDLESKCTIHDCFNLMDGRKACGGKLEVKIRIRDPLLVKQVEEVREKWLVIGS